MGISIAGEDNEEEVTRWEGYQLTPANKRS